MASASAARALSKKVLNVATLPNSILQAQYAVRGELVLRAAKLEAQGRAITYCNIGNPHQLQQQPITFFRQVLAATAYPALIDSSVLPADARARAKAYLDKIPGGTGAYSHSQGIPVIRNEVADFLARRDGVPANADDIYLTDGASPGIQRILSLLIDPVKKTDGILIPIPQYPLYSASITLLGGHILPYNLDESRNWALSLESLQKAVAASRAQGVQPKAIVVINPGNPTGQILDAAQIATILKFAEEQQLVVLADEVYQTNTYARGFVSFKKIAAETRFSGELVSFHSVSKGVLGECGRRGGYFECLGIDDLVKEQIYKLQSIGLCANVDGQIMTGLMVNPPKKGDESFSQYESEVSSLFESLKRRAAILSQELNSVKGISCNPAEGALYAFPQIHLPSRFVEHAKSVGKAADTLYCLEMLEATGVCVVPGSGFGQADGTWHFRTTILPQEKVLGQVLKSVKSFHEGFMKKWE
jgi:aspartate/methionine/tyrosine aminotransferase